MRDRFSHLIQSDKPVLVDFYADWCAPCRMMSPVLKELKSRCKDQLRIIKVNVDDHPVIARKYRIQSIPALLLFQKGEIQWQSLGVKSSEILYHQLKKFL